MAFLLSLPLLCRCLCPPMLLSLAFLHPLHFDFFLYFIHGLCPCNCKRKWKWEMDRQLLHLQKGKGKSQFIDSNSNYEGERLTWGPMAQKERGELVLKSIKQQSAPHTHTHLASDKCPCSSRKMGKGERKVNRFATRRRQLASSPARQVTMWALGAPDWFLFGE